MVSQLAECLGTILREEASKLKTSPTKLPVRRRTINRIKDAISNSDLVSNINFLLADIDRLILCERSEVKALRITTDKITRLVNHELSKNRLIKLDNILNLMNLECRFNVDVSKEWVDGNPVITAKIVQSDALNEYCKVQLD